MTYLTPSEQVYLKSQMNEAQTFVRAEMRMMSGRQLAQVSVCVCVCVCVYLCIVYYSYFSDSKRKIRQSPQCSV
jgi:hypothetical protein